MKSFFHSFVAAAAAVALTVPAGAWAANEEKPKTELPSKKEESKEAKKKKNDKKDVEQIGERDVGKGVNWYSLE